MQMACRLRRGSPEAESVESAEAERVGGKAQQEARARARVERKFTSKGA